jgi:two-component system response regulator FixJ
MKNTVYVIDDDIAVRTSLERSLRHHGYHVVTYDSGTTFLAAIKDGSYGCIILDIAMPAMSGLEVQAELLQIGCKIPIIFMTGHGDVPTSVRALKNGAVEFFEKPFAIDQLMERVELAIKGEEIRTAEDTKSEDVCQKFASLTDREVDVMAGLVAGFANRSNKEVARDLDISHRTVEIYRSRIMEKMGASSLTHLVEMAKICGAYHH